MVFLYILILAVLVYIAYQLYRLNESETLGIKEDRYKEMFPHLYRDANEEDKEKLRDFVNQNESDNISNYIYLERYKQMNEAIAAEPDNTKRENMIATKEIIVNELKSWQDIFDKTEERKEISSWEVSYLLWGYLQAMNESFPARYTDMSDYVKYSGFSSLSV